MNLAVRKTILFPAKMYIEKPGSEVIKHYFMLNYNETKIYPALNVEVPTIVGVLTFISRLKDSVFSNCKIYSSFGISVF